MLLNLKTGKEKEKEKRLPCVVQITKKKKKKKKTNPASYEKKEILQIINKGVG
jgi:hypothetical protein